MSVHAHDADTKQVAADSICRLDSMGMGTNLVQLKQAYLR